LRFNFTAILLVFHRFPAKSDTHIFWAELYYSLLTEPVSCAISQCAWLLLCYNHL